MRVYECIIDCGDNAFKADIAARNKNELLDEWGGNGEFIRIKDVTSKYTFSEHTDWFTELQDALAGKFSEGEIRLICALVDEQIDRIEGYGAEGNKVEGDKIKENRAAEEDDGEIKTSEKLRKVFSRNLNDLLIERDRKQADIARGIGTSTALVSVWCQGRSLPCMENLQKIADYFGVSKSFLLEER